MKKGKTLQELAVELERQQAAKRDMIADMGALIPPSLYTQVEEVTTLIDNEEINKYLAAGWKILWIWNANDPRMMLAQIAETRF